MELKTGEVLLGTIAASQDKAEIAAGPERREVPLADVVALRHASEQRTWERLRHPGFAQLWAGTAAL